MNKIIFVIDWKSDKDFTISKHLINSGMNVTTLCMPNLTIEDYVKKTRYPILLFKYLMISLKAIMNSDKVATIINWNFTVGFCCCLIRFFSFKKPQIICLNIIAHESKGLIGFIRKKLFTFFLNRPGIYITANSEDLFKQFNAEFDIDYNKMFVLEDPILSVYERREYIPQRTYIFCGGVAKRDWKTYFKASELLPEYKFVGVASRNGFPKDLPIPANVEMYFDISLDNFNSLLKGASIQVLPLTSMRPAGLIGLITGAMLSIPVITTETPSMQNYVKNNENGILVKLGDQFALANAIKVLYNDFELCKKQVHGLQNFIEANFSEQAYAKRLGKIIKQVNRTV